MGLSTALLGGLTGGGGGPSRAGRDAAFRATTVGRFSGQQLAPSTRAALTAGQERVRQLQSLGTFRRGSGGPGSPTGAQAFQRNATPLTQRNFFARQSELQGEFTGQSIRQAAENRTLLTQLGVFPPVGGAATSATSIRRPQLARRFPTLIS